MCNGQKKKSMLGLHLGVNLDVSVDAGKETT